MKVTIIVSSLGAGGAERVLTSIANYLHTSGFSITFITYSQGKDFYEVNPSIARKSLNLMRNSNNPLEMIKNLKNRVLNLRAAIKETNPDTVLSFIDKTNILTIMATVGLSYRIVISERTNPQHYQIAVGWKILRWLTYRWADVLVIQTRALLPWAKKMGIARKTVIIPNALDQRRVIQINDALSSVKIAGRRRVVHEPFISIVAMGRLTTEKGHDLLLQACAPILHKHKNCQLSILGQGPLLTNLEQMASDLGIAEQVSWLGQKSNPFPFLAESDIFILPSRVEGFPNVLLEAMALGIPAISFDCPSGPADLIEDGKNGLLVAAQDVAGMTAAIEKIMYQPVLREQLGKQAQISIKRYAEEPIMQMWMKVLAP